jgi:hypothetical protein
MSRRRRTPAAFPLPNPFFAQKARQTLPHAFVLDALVSLSPETRPMFGCTGVYVGEKIVLLLRDKPDRVADNGVWLITTKDHHASLIRDFPNLRSMSIPGKGPPGWQLLPADSPDFESACLHACELILARDPRIGRIPDKAARTRRRATTP